MLVRIDKPLYLGNKQMVRGEGDDIPGIYPQPREMKVRL